MSTDGVTVSKDGVTVWHGWVEVGQPTNDNGDAPDSDSDANWLLIVSAPNDRMRAILELKHWRLSRSGRMATRMLVLRAGERPESFARLLVTGQKCNFGTERFAETGGDY